MRTREWAKLDYLDPEPILVGLREIALTQPLNQLPYKVSSLRTRELRKYGESRQCALFCYLVGKAIERKVRYAEVEQSDYDCIAHFEKEDEHNFVPIQVKELVPETVNPKASLQTIIDDLSKYTDSKDLVVAVHLNRAGSVRLSELNIPSLNIKELWFYGANGPDQAEWTIMGNLLETNARFFEIRYPGA